MTQPMRPRRPALPIALALAIGAICLPAAAFAQSAPDAARAGTQGQVAAAEPAAQSDPSAPPADPNIARLSDEQRNAILAANTEESAAAARGELPEAERLGRGVHGEVGMMIGTGGMRGVYGMADIPLGDSGDLMVAYENMRYGHRR